MKRLNDTLFLEALKKQVHGSRADYRAFYSSFLGGITTEAHHMIVPIDDHMVHRGDAVFEAVKFVDRNVYALDRHLERLEISASNISLPLPLSRLELTDLILETVKASGLDLGIIRLFLSRGPGGFTTNPYETTGTQIYCAITTYKAQPSEKYERGVSAAMSKFRVKEGFFAQTKTCNYLPNVLMKKEALDRKVDFVVSFDEDGFLAEGSTENFAWIDSRGTFVVPPFARMLRGVTLVRAMELARVVGITVEQRKFRADELKTAKGAMMLGTTIDVLPVSRFEDQDFGSVPHETKNLIRAFSEDLISGPLRVAF